MTINKFKVFTWDRILLYILPPVLLVVALVAALIHGTTPAVGLIILGIVILVWSAMSSVEFYLRNKFAEEIQAYTPDGTGIIPGYVTTPDINQLVKDIGDAELEVINFWSGKLIKPISTFIDYINGGFISFTKTPIDLTDHSPTGPLVISTGLSRWAAGVTYGNSCCIQYSGELSGWSQSLKCIRHEAGHKCLSAVGMGLTSDEQHVIMKQYGFQY